MCVSPIPIPNPNKGKFVSSLTKRLVDVTSSRIYVPCGHCGQCVKLKQMSIVQRVQMESVSNELFYCTLTYNNKMLPVVDINGFKIKYSDVKDLQNMFKHLRRDNAFGVPFRYFAVSELGSKRGRPHFHILFIVDRKYCKDFLECSQLESVMFHKVLDYWSRNIGSDKYPVYEPCCTYVRKWCHGVLKSTYDLHYLNPSLSADGVSDVSFYVLKYMIKPSERAVNLQRALRLNLSPDDYHKYWNLVKPRYIFSKYFGLSGVKVVNVDGSFKWQLNENSVKYVKDCLRISLREGSSNPSFFNPVNGKSFPLSKYYRNKYLSVSDALEFKSRQKLSTGSVSDDGSLNNLRFGDSSAFTKAASFDRLLEKIDSRTDVFDIDF